MALTERSSRGAKSNLAFLSMVPLDIWSWIAAAETAAWRLKWVMLPVTLLIAFGGRRLYRSIRKSPADFCGARCARAGLLASATVPLLILILIGVTVPERLRHRQDGIDAGVQITRRTVDRAVLEYKLKFQRVPNELIDLRQLPDADGSIAAALNTLNPSIYPNAYRPYAELAAKQNPQTLRGAVISKASLGAASEDAIGEGLSFTGYDLRLPGPDKLMGTDDDLMVRDGVITKPSESTRRLGSTAASTEAAQR